jgi:hypothetical protein
MKIKLRTVPIGTSTRFFKTIWGDPGQSAHALLTEVVVDGVFSGIFSCGPAPFDHMKMEKDGDVWVIHMEATTA